MKNGGLFSATTAALFPSRWTKEEYRGAFFPDFPSNGDLAVSKSHHGAAVAAATDDAGVRLGESIPRKNPRLAQITPQLPRYDPFSGQRVAVVVPYVGRDLPVWWDAFAEQAKLNDGLIDWIIFCDQASYP